VRCRLEFTDVGLGTSDPTLRTGLAEFKDPEFKSITGISGSPVFDITANALCGMVVRGVHGFLRHHALTRRD
jgi:hypothetical protein